MSLEMAHRIAIARRDGGTGAKFLVKGMVFIDSICPNFSPEMRARLPGDPIILSAQESEAMKLKDKVNVNMTHARMMVSFWELPKIRRPRNINQTRLTKKGSCLTGIDVRENSNQDVKI